MALLFPAPPSAFTAKSKVSSAPKPPYVPPSYPGVQSGTAEDFFTGIKQGNRARIDELYGQKGHVTASDFARDAAATSFMNIRSGGGYALPIGFANLAEMLANQGRTDPRALNMQLTDVSRSGAAQQDLIREQMAQLGLGGSGLGAALGAASGQATQNARSRAIAAENAQAEERKRGDLGLLYDLIIGPSVQGYGIERGVAIQTAAQRQQRDAANQAALSQILSGIAVGACWVAREVYGFANPKWLRFRHWLFTEADEALRASYLAHGPALARFLRANPHFKPALRAGMDRILGA
jgi:hypothetical protein